MGYTIRIGQAEMEPVGSDCHEYCYYVPELNLPEAPAAPNDVNPHCNYRWPSYGQWDYFAREVGLHELFYSDDGGLLRPHPGVIVLRPHHATTISAALAAYKQRYPEAVARFDCCVGLDIIAEMTAPPQHPECDYALARLEWLAWWTDWAIANCSRPAMENS